MGRTRLVRLHPDSHHHIFVFYYLSIGGGGGRGIKKKMVSLNVLENRCVSVTQQNKTQYDEGCMSETKTERQAFLDTHTVPMGAEPGPPNKLRAHGRQRLIVILSRVFYFIRGKRRIVHTNRWVFFSPTRTSFRFEVSFGLGRNVLYR